MRICVMIEGQEGLAWSDWQALARAAEQAGLEGLFRSDHYAAIHGTQEGALDAWTTIAALAAQTQKLRLGTLVSPATFRHPSLLARVVASADQISNGRVELGMGTGWFELEHTKNGFAFPDLATRFDIFAEQVEIIVRSWTETDFDFRGKYFTLANQYAAPQPLQRPYPPLIMGGMAKSRSVALAVRYAQEYNAFMRSPQECADLRAKLDDACEDAGRDPQSLSVSLMTPVALGTTSAEARQRYERALAVSPKSREMLANAADKWLMGSLDEAASRIAELRRSGVSRIFLQQLDYKDLGAVELMGQLARQVATS